MILIGRMHMSEMRAQNMKMIMSVLGFGAKLCVLMRCFYFYVRISLVSVFHHCSMLSYFQFPYFRCIQSELQRQAAIAWFNKYFFSWIVNKNRYCVFPSLFKPFLRTPKLKNVSVLEMFSTFISMQRRTTTMMMKRNGEAWRKFLYNMQMNLSVDLNFLC